MGNKLTKRNRSRPTRALAMSTGPVSLSAAPPLSAAPLSALEEQDNPLSGMIDLLNTAADIANKVNQPISTVNADLQKVNGYIDNIEDFIKSLNDCVSACRNLGDACYALTEIPGVGEVLDVLGNALRDFAKTVDEALTPINDFRKDVLDKVKSIIQDICNVCGKVSGYLTYFATNVPVWTNTVQVLYHGWEIVSVLISLLDGTEPAERLKGLLEKFKAIGDTASSALDAIKDGFEGVIKVVGSVLKPAIDTVEHFFTAVFQPLFDHLKGVTDVFGSIESVIDKVEDAIAPVRWALDAVSCIFKKVINPVIDFIMDKLGLKGLVDGFMDKITKAFHLDDFLGEIEKVFNLDHLGSSSTSMSSCADKASQVNQFSAALKDYTSDPTQGLLTAVLVAVSGAPVSPGAFPPGPIPMPPLNVDHPFEGHMAFLKTSLQQKLKVKQALLLTYTPVTFPPTVVPPFPPSSPTDMPDVDQLINDVGACSAAFQPVLTLGGQMQQFLNKIKEQMGIPAILNSKLSQLLDLAKFLYDLFHFLQAFPVLNVILTPLTDSLADELKTIGDLGTNMNQLMQSTSALSTALQPIVAANSPALTATISKLECSLDNWRAQADKYRGLLQHSYSLDKTGKFKPRIDALATAYHQHISQLISTLNKIKDYVSTAGKDGYTISKELNAVYSQFDKLDHGIDQLEMAIDKVGKLAHFTAKLDGIFHPLQFMLHHYNCIGDSDNIKLLSMKWFQEVADIARSPTVQKVFEGLSNEVINHFFPVQSVMTMVEDTKNAVTVASATITQTQSGYLAVLQSIEKTQIGNHQFTYYNSQTKKTETVNNAFFSDTEVSEATQLGKDMSDDAS